MGVFRDRPLAGNPRCVVLDDGPESVMQAVAREVNLSETTVPTVTAPWSYRNRIFTPSAELPFADTRRSARRGPSGLAAVSADLSDATPDQVAIAALCHRHQVLALGAVRRVDDGTLHVRVVVPLAGIREDPGTGAMPGPSHGSHDTDSVPAVTC